MKRILATAALLLAIPVAFAQTTPPAKTETPPLASGCERMKSDMQEMGDHMHKMAKSGMGCGHGAKDGKMGMMGGHKEMGSCMDRMSEMMKDMAPIAKECDRMTPEMKSRMERHEKEMAEWRKAPAN